MIVHYFLYYPFHQKADPDLTKKHRRDFLDILITARDESGNGLTSEEIRAEVDTFLFAGGSYNISFIIHTKKGLYENAYDFYNNSIYSLFMKKMANTYLHLIYHVYLGHDTTASAISWAIYSLAKYPEIQEKVHQEAVEILGERQQLEW
jgi:hypothetical protein